MFAIASLLVVVTVSLLITRVATVILVATGLSRSAARFQARSAFTGSGFTTQESERVVDHPVRRRVIMVLMLVGNAGLVAAASSLIIGFRGGGPGRDWVRVLELVGGLLVLVYLSRSPWIDRRLTAAIAAILRRFTELPAQDSGYLASLPDGHVVAELAVREGDWLAGRSLAQLGLRQLGATVLGVQRRDDGYRHAPGGETVVRAGDTLVVSAHERVLRELDRRPAAASSYIRSGRS